MAEDCDELEDLAQDAYDDWVTNMEIYEEEKKYADYLNYRDSLCWQDFQSSYENLNPESMRNHARECVELEQAEEEREEEVADAKFDMDESWKEWQRAEDKLDDCLHEENTVKMKLEE